MIVIICAMKKEIDALLKALGEYETIDGRDIRYQDKILGNDYYVGKIGNKEVAVIESGIGMTYASIVTLLAIEMLALSDESLAAKLKEFRKAQAEKVLADDAALQQELQQ